MARGADDVKEGAGEGAVPKPPEFADERWQEKIRFAIHAREDRQKAREGKSPVFTTWQRGLGKLLPK
jgi:hypothetical protein